MGTVGLNGSYPINAGYNGYGQLGDNSTTSRKVPTPVTGNATWSMLPTPGSAASLSNTPFTCAIMLNNTMACWVRGALQCLAWVAPAARSTR